MTRIAVIGARDFTVKGKYPTAGSAAAEVVQGFMEGLPKYATIVCGGQYDYPDGVDAWVYVSFQALKDKKKFHFVEMPPQHLQGKPYHELDWTNRRTAIIDGSDKLFVFIPNDYNGGETGEILKIARMRHLPHTVFRVDPRGDVTSVLEVKSKDTFVPIEVKVDAKSRKRAEDRTNELPKRTVHRKPVMLKRSRAVQKTGTPKRSTPATGKSGSRGKVSVPARPPVRLKRVANSKPSKPPVKSAKRVSKKPTKGKHVVLKRKIGK